MTNFVSVCINRSRRIRSGTGNLSSQSFFGDICQLQQRKVLEVYQESFVNGDAKPLKVITTDDFEFVMTDGTSMSKEETLNLGIEY